ncbi:MAG: hypothetical protein V5A27_09940 [Halapricum sp.]
MAAKDRNQGGDVRVDGVVPAGDDDLKRPAVVETVLDRTNRSREAVIEQYERTLATKERLRRETGSDETFVWTGEDSRESERIVALLARLR